MPGRGPDERRRGERETRRDVPKFTYAVPSSAAALLGEVAQETHATSVLWVYNAVTAAHLAADASDASGKTVREVESCVRLEAAREAEWDEASIESSRPDGNGYLVLAFQEGGGVGSADSGRNAADAAAQCASRLNGRTFEERELFVRYAPLS